MAETETETVGYCATGLLSLVVVVVVGGGGVEGVVGACEWGLIGIMQVHPQLLYVPVTDGPFLAERASRVTILEGSGTDAGKE